MLRVEHVTGAEIAARMSPAWIAAVAATGVVTWLAFPTREVDTGSNFPRASGRLGAGGVGVIFATALIIATPDPALPVLILGAVVLAVAVLRGNLICSRLRHVVDLPVLLGLLGLAVGLGAIGRTWGRTLRPSRHRIALADSSCQHRIVADL